MSAPSTQAGLVQRLNDHFRAAIDFPLGPPLRDGQLVVTRGVAARGNGFIDRAVRAVREFSAFTPENDPHGEHDFGEVSVGGTPLFWKIDCYDTAYRYGSPNPADADKTRRVLTILLPEEY